MRLQKRPSGGNRFGGGGMGGSLGDVMSIAGKGFRDVKPPVVVPVSLPTLSILNTDADIDPADLKAGEAAARAAGLS